MYSKKAFTLLAPAIFLLSQLWAQDIVVYANGTLGVNRSYASIGAKYYYKRTSIISFEFGGGLMGTQNETAGNSQNISGQNGFEASISSSMVIAPDPNVPDHMYLAKITTRFTGEFFRASYEWRFPSSKSGYSGRPKGFHMGVEFAYFDMIQRQAVEFRSVSTPEAYDFSGTARAVVVAPGLRLGYDLVLFQNLLVSPEVATPLYIPIGNKSKSNGPFAKEGIDFRLGIGWFIH